MEKEENFHRGSQFNAGCSLGIVKTSKGEVSLPEVIGKEISRIEELEESKNETVYSDEFRNGVTTGLASFKKEIKIFFKDGTWVKISK